MDYINQARVGNVDYIVGLPNIYINSKGNFNIETSAELGNTSKGKINIESMSDIQIKPGDDVIFYSHHRAEGKQDEVAIKVTDGDDVPVKLLLNAAELVLTTKDKPVDSNPDVLDIAINANTDTRGYLKVRAQAIDLRCEKHGGVALLPKGYDGEGNMNKIKFEHGGGDGLEFGTFNTEKTSLFTDEYRFNKDGVWKMATRETTPSGKTIRDEGAVPTGKQATAALKYVKQSDDFYDIIDSQDAQTTTEAIIKTAHDLNSYGCVSTDADKNGFELVGYAGAVITEINDAAFPSSTSSDIIVEWETMTIDVPYKVGEFVKASDLASIFRGDDPDSFSREEYIIDYCSLEDDGTIVEIRTNNIQLKFKTCRGNLTFAPDSTRGKLKLKGILDFGSSFNFGETDDGIEVQYKLTKKNAEKDCGVIKVVGVNNHASNNLTVEGVTIAPGNTEVIAQCSILDIVKLVNYMKTNNEGPWASQL